MSARTDAITGELRAAAAVLRQPKGASAVSDAAAELLEAFAAYWSRGWLPADPTPTDKAVVMLARAILPKADAS